MLQQFQTLRNFLPLSVALLFAAHPMNTEVVTYISHRSESLATLFYLISLLFFAKSLEKDDAGINRTKNKFFYALSLLSFVFSFFSKQIAITLPIALGIFDFIFLSNFKLSQVIEKKKYHIPYWILLILFLLFRAFYIGRIGDPSPATYQRWTPYTYFITQPLVLLSYLRLLLIPIGQSIDHHLPPFKSLFDLNVILPFLIHAGLCYPLYFNCKKYLAPLLAKEGTTPSPLLAKEGTTPSPLLAKERVRVRIPLTVSPTFKLILFSAFWFYLTLLPTSSFFPINDPMTERRVYLPGLGFFLTITILYLSIFRISLEKIRLKLKTDQDYMNQRKRQKTMFWLLGIHIFLLSVMTIRRNELYKDPSLLWEQVVSAYGRSVREYINLGKSYYENNEHEKALAAYLKALEFNPKDSGRSDIYYDIGLIYRQTKDYPKAIVYFQQAVAVKQDHLKAHYNLGDIYYREKEYEKAIEEFEIALTCGPLERETKNIKNNITAVNQLIRKEVKPALKK